MGKDLVEYFIFRFEELILKIMCSYDLAEPDKKKYVYCLA
jgi:hypothetical protein